MPANIASHNALEDIDMSKTIVIFSEPILRVCYVKPSFAYLQFHKRSVAGY